MFYFEAVLRPQAVEAICRKLLEWGQVEELVAWEVLGAGRRYESGTANLVVDTLPKMVVAGMVRDADRDELVERISGRARTGRLGDGKLFFYRIDGIR